MAIVARFNENENIKEVNCKLVFGEGFLVECQVNAEIVAVFYEIEKQKRIRLRQEFDKNTRHSNIFLTFTASITYFL